MVSWPELFLLAVSPSVVLLWFFRHKDRYEHEPILFMAKVFLLGAATVIPVGLFEFLVGDPVFHPDDGLLQSIVFFFVVVGPVEEFGKFAAVRVRAYRSAEFDEPMDGIVLGVSAALGFATVENIGFVFLAPTVGERLFVGIVRGFLSVPGHAFWGAIIGFYLGQAKFLKRPGLAYVGLGLAALFHGSFDSVTSIVGEVAGYSAGLALFGIIVLVGIVWIGYLKVVKPEISEAEEQSPYKNEKP